MKKRKLGRREKDHLLFLFCFLYLQTVGFGHLAVNGAKQYSSSNHPFQGNTSSSAFAMLKRVFSGHFHVHQQLQPNLVYVGRKNDALFLLSFSLSSLSGSFPSPPFVEHQKEVHCNSTLVMLVMHEA
jgi:hypothetical protein